MQCTRTEVREQLILSRKSRKAKAGLEREQVIICWTREGGSISGRDVRTATTPREERHLLNVWSLE